MSNEEHAIDVTELLQRNNKLERIANSARRYRIIARLPNPTEQGISALVQTGRELDEALDALPDGELENAINNMRDCVSAGIVSRRSLAEYVTSLCANRG